MGARPTPSGRASCAARTNIELQLAYIGNRITFIDYDYYWLLSVFNQIRVFSDLLSNILQYKYGHGINKAIDIVV